MTDRIPFTTYGNDGPEAYIPLGPEHPRSLAILAEAQRRLITQPDYVAVCVTCGAKLTSKDRTLTIEHAEDGAHVVSMTYGG